ncbi:HET-domain-containing protein, partial [Cadophora sp. DSE1049]
MLCETCKTIDVDKLIPRREGLEADGVVKTISGTQHHAHFADLGAAAAAGCQFCSAIEKSAAGLITQVALRQRLRSSPIELKMRLKGYTDLNYQGASELWASCDGRIVAQMETFVPQESALAQPGLKIIRGRPVSSNPRSEESFGLAKAWIHDCLTSREHTACSENKRGSNSSGMSGTTSLLPTRLIDVGPPDGSESPKLTLSSSIDPQACQNYAALSHCWGGGRMRQIGNLKTLADEMALGHESFAVQTSHKPLTTLSENLEQRMRGIPMPILPRTFQDAVIVTRGLGLRYLWIDSLCIIQNSKADWEKEASQMADIYKSSYVTIAAESSPDSYGGMLNERVPDFEPIELPFISTTRNIRSSMYVRAALDDWETCITGAVYSTSTLCSRAWVLQESVLAPRTIHFSAQQMFWQCRSRSLAEGDMMPIPFNPGERSWSWSQNKRFLAPIETIPEKMGNLYTKGITKTDIRYLQWYSITRNYSARKLTFASDVLPALVGLATEFNRHLTDQYVAGLWRRDLLRGLLWTVQDPERADEAKPYRAPSWSWASIVGEIDELGDTTPCIRLVEQYHAQIIDVQVTPAAHTRIASDGNYYGEIVAGVLSIRGRWRPCSRWPRFEEKFWQRHIVPDTEDGFGIMFRYFDCGDEPVHLERHRRRRTLTLLEIAAWVVNEEDPPVSYFLILESGDFDDRSQFRRVGLVALHNTEDYEGWLHDWETGDFMVV